MASVKQQAIHKQQMSISTQVRQSLELLHMHTFDLQQVILEAAEQNPFLEIKMPSHMPTTRHTPSLYTRDDLENLSNRPLSLREHLMKQIEIQGFTASQQLLAFQFTEYLDPYGYLTLSLEAIATEISCLPEDLAELLPMLHQLEPTGVYARNLRECLELQLRDRGQWSPAYQTMLDNLVLVARRDLGALARACKLSVEEVSLMVSYIKTLDPKPGRNFEQDMAIPLLPEAMVELDKNNQLLVSFNRANLPDIVVQAELYQGLASRASQEDRKALQEYYKQAKWLYKAIEHRSHTIVNVTKTVVELQYEFFIYGISHLKPMTLKQVANKLNLHESTISRVSNKCISTQFGIFPLKYFFASEIKSSIYENTYSSHAVKERIKNLITGENPSKPLSDDMITLQLQGEGLIISRRTVAKYREAMRLAPSHQRRIRGERVRRTVDKPA